MNQRKEADPQTEGRLAEVEDNSKINHGPFFISAEAVYPGSDGQPLSTETPRINPTGAVGGG